jgi:hypothetical protein
VGGRRERAPRASKKKLNKVTKKQKRLKSFQNRSLGLSLRARVRRPRWRWGPALRAPAAPGWMMLMMLLDAIYI